MILLVVDTQKGCLKQDLEFMRALDFVSFISLLYQFSVNIQFKAVCVDL
jgi:hypothetical protein